MDGKGMRRIGAAIVALGVLSLVVGRGWVRWQEEQVAPVSEGVSQEQSVDALAAAGAESVTVVFDVLHEEDILKKEEFPPGDYHSGWPPEPVQPVPPSWRRLDSDSWDRTVQ